ncbi:MAG: SDR family oxidoreductase [Pseudomonadota bacterium]
MRLKGKTVLVTAAAAGIGRATALMCVAEGAEVWAADRDAAGLDALRGESAGIRTLTLDVCDQAQVDAAFAKVGVCDALVNAVGIVPGGTVIEMRTEELQRAFEINVVSMVRMTQAALPGMLEKGAGSIVQIASVASSITGVANRCAYGVTKAAVIGLAKSIAADFVTQGVRCNTVCPGTIDTPSLQARLAAQPDPAAALVKFKARQPMNRLGRAEEVAAAAVFLVSDEASFITGQNIVVDGGWTI